MWCSVSIVFTLIENPAVLFQKEQHIHVFFKRRNDIFKPSVNKDSFMFSICFLSSIPVLENKAAKFALEEKSVIVYLTLIAPGLPLIMADPGRDPTLRGCPWESWDMQKTHMYMCEIAQI